MFGRRGTDSKSDNNRDVSQTSIQNFDIKHADFDRQIMSSNSNNNSVDHNKYYDDESKIYHLKNSQPKKYSKKYSPPRPPGSGAPGATAPEPAPAPLRPA